MSKLGQAGIGRGVLKKVREYISQNRMSAAALLELCESKVILVINCKFHSKTYMES